MVPVALRNYRAESRGERQSVGGLVLREVGEPELSPSSVIVEVKSVALSQLDVLADLGLARNESNPLGRDFAGVVLEVGEAVEDLAVGDAVAGVHEGAFARRLAVERSFLVRKPSFFSFNEAASLPYAFLVARYSLEVVGRLRAGERLLVASSSGGIGRAMVSVARSIGAEVSTVSSSASPVGNEEFDVIVGAESGAPMHALVSRLAPGGRYLDLCPRFDFERPEIGALRLGANRSLTAIDVRELMRSDPALVSALLEKTFEEAERGASISMSTTVFPVRGAGRALRFMAQNRHRGRVCIDVSDPEALQIEPMAADIASGSLAGRGPFLVSGEGDSLRDGVVEWLHDRYADWVVVSSCANPLEDLAKRMDPSDRLGGWIHFAQEASGVRDRTRESLILAEADARILVSVRPSVVGDPARDRAWETRLWVDGLMTSSTPSSGTTLDLSVGEATTVDSVVEVLDRMMQGETLDSQIVLLDGAELEQRLTTASSPLLSGLEQDSGVGGRGRITRAEFQSLSTPERRVEMQRFVLSELAQVLGLEDAQRDALDPASRLDSVGLDSLMSLELFMGMGRSLEIEISQDWFDSIPTIAEIGVTLADRYAAAIARGSD